jgi:transposase
MRPAELGRVLGGVCLVVLGARATGEMTVSAKTTADALRSGDIQRARRAGQAMADSMSRTPLPKSAQKDAAVSCTEYAWIATMSAWDGGDGSALPLTVTCLVHAVGAIAGRRPSTSDLWQLLCESSPGLRTSLPKPAGRLFLSSEMAKRTRARARKLLSLGQPMDDVASRLGVVPKTIEKWRENPTPATRKLRKLDAQGEAKLRMILASPPKDAGYPAACWTLELVTRMLGERLGVKYDLSSLRELLDRMQPGIYVPPYCDPQLSADNRLMALALLMPRTETSDEQRAVWDHAVHVIRHSDPSFFPQVVELVLRESKDIEQAAGRLRISTRITRQWHRRLAADGLAFDSTADDDQDLVD